MHSLLLLGIVEYWFRHFFSCLQNFGSDETDAIAYRVTYKNSKLHSKAELTQKDFLVIIPDCRQMPTEMLMVGSFGMR